MPPIDKAVRLGALIALKGMSVKLGGVIQTVGLLVIPLTPAPLAELGKITPVTTILDPPVEEHICVLPAKIQFSPDWPQGALVPTFRGRSGFQQVWSPGSDPPSGLHS